MWVVLKGTEFDFFANNLGLIKVNTNPARENLNEI